MEASLPVVANAIGAIVERCHGRPWTWLLPRESGSPTVLGLFARLYESGLQLPARWVPMNGLPLAEAFYFDAYLEPAREAARLRTGGAGVSAG